MQAPEGEKRIFVSDEIMGKGEEMRKKRGQEEEEEQIGTSAPIEAWKCNPLVNDRPTNKQTDRQMWPLGSYTYKE